MHRSKFSTFFLSTFIVLLLATLIPSAQAQDPTPPPTVDPESPAAIELREAVQQLLDDYAARFALARISEYNIVYFVAPDVANIDTMQAYTGAQIASDWETVMQIDNARPIDALIVHASRADAVDTGWTQDAYQNRAVVMVAVNRYFQTLGQWTGSHCQRTFEVIVPPFDGDYFIHSYIHVETDDPALRSQIVNAQLTICDRLSAANVVDVPEGVQAQISAGSLQYHLDIEEDYNILQQTLLSVLYRFGG